jgi:hypothetical protein
MVGRTLIRTAFAAISASRMVCRQNSRLANLAFLFHPLWGCENNDPNAASISAALGS